MSSNRIPEMFVSSWDEFDNYVSSLPYREWIFRGQSDESWPLESAYRRRCSYMMEVLGVTNLARNGHELNMLRKFKQHASIYLEKTPSKEEDAEWMSLMQHHGVPTRLLDWSFSPYIAAYFAASSEGKKDFAIYCMDQVEFRKMDEEVFTKAKYEQMKTRVLARRKTKPYIFAYESKFAHKRLVAQQSVFTVPSTNYQTYNEILNDYELDGTFVKLTVDCGQRKEWLARLVRMNINEATLFPDLDGFCRSMSFDLLHSVSKLKSVK